MQATMQQKNNLLFLGLLLLLMFSWFTVRQLIWPPPPPKKPDAAKQAAAPAAAPKEEPRPPEPTVAVRAVPPPPVTPEGKLLTLGSTERASKFHLGVVLDPRGAGVRSVVLNKFQQADELGLPVWQDPEKKVPRPLELVAGEANRESPSNLLYHYDVTDPSDDKPLDTLGRAEWRVVRRDGQKSVTFEAEAQGVVVTKTYTLAEGEYHLGLEVKLRRKEGGDRKKLEFRYQLTGAHGLRVEGRWYTSTFRNALVGVVDPKRYVRRNLQDLRQISLWAGGKDVGREDGLLRYAGVAVQYFGSVIVVDDDEKKQPLDQQRFLARARPTLEVAVAKGVVKSVGNQGAHFVLATETGDLPLEVATDPEVRERFKDLHAGARVAVIYHTASAVWDRDLKRFVYPHVATELRDEAATHALWEDDITVRVMTEPVELKPGQEVVHRYLLYNGPVKPRLLGQLSGDAQVDQDLVNRYSDKLHLDTLTDYHSPGVMGEFASRIFWTELLIKCTNLMHLVLGYLHKLVPSYGLCIILLTVMVRGLMFPVSRKQALTTLRMQELAPELKKLQEKYKDDRQALGMAQMELYRKHGVNPFGTCWFLLLQMPIFMGLYYALQESIHFRLAPFWPTWIDNLAAPDMLIPWGERIPWISSPDSYGSLLYLGPYFNLLPVIAVGLMIMQQKLVTPPPADEQQEMQQKMMKYMMIFFGLMFYKVAAGLGLYFIASSAWGFAERKLLPKRKPDGGERPAEAPAPNYFQKLLGRTGAPEGAITATPGVGRSSAITTTPSPGDGRGRGRNKQGRNRRRDRGRDEGRVRSGLPDPAESGSPLAWLRGWWRERGTQLREWWSEVLRQAKKK
jgi:YidC/Oxa1 family membrane protein insertase